MCYHHGASSRRGFYSHGHRAAQHPAFGHWAKRFAAWQGEQGGSVPVNLLEKKDWYELYLYAPGLSKDAFQVNVADDVLSIRFQADSDHAETNWIYREYPRASFELRFQLNGKVDTSAITARYTDGVLELVLPKAPGSAGQDIAIA